jgi:hypothetical protein
MDVVGLNDDNAMNDIDEHEHNQMVRIVVGLTRFC